MKSLPALIAGIQIDGDSSSTGAIAHHPILLPLGLVALRKVCPFMKHPS